MKAGLAALTVCSTAFTTLGRAQAKARGYPDLPIAIVPHPFGTRSRDEIREMAAACVGDIARLICEPSSPELARGARAASSAQAQLVEVPEDPYALKKFFEDQRWSDGLPLIAPTAERVEHMLAQAQRARGEVIATIAPAFGAATVERIAINAVIAGCEPSYLPILIAAVEALTTPKFNLCGIQTTTNPAAVWLIVNGPIAARLGVNGGSNCLGPGSAANATLGRALQHILRNIGGALPGEMDRATHGQPGKYTFCCAENEEANPWEPLHVERGFARDCDTVTVVGALGTWNMHTTAEDAADVLRVMADTMAFPAGSDYAHAGEPWLVLSPEHAQMFKQAGMSKREVKGRLWEQSKLAASRLAPNDFARTQSARRAELGEIGPDTLLPISLTADDISIIVAGGPGVHSLYVPVSGTSRSVTREIVS